MVNEDNMYDVSSINFLELMWGNGYLSPGGPEEVARLLKGIKLTDKTVLDIGCGSGGITLSLSQDYGAKKVIGIDVEGPVCEAARKRISHAGFTDYVDIKLVNPGLLQFEEQSFDIVFSKDSVVHIADKFGLSKNVFQILKPNGWFVASDWLIAHDDEPSAEMKYYVKMENLDFAMASPKTYRHALQQAGFIDILLDNRNGWYYKQASEELSKLEGAERTKFESIVGKSLVKSNIKTWQAMLCVLKTGEHCPHHFRARKPG